MIVADSLSEIHQSLSQALETSYLNANVISPEQYRTGLILNDKNRQLKVISTLTREIRACQSFSFSVAFITSGGLSSILSSLVDARERGIRGRILTSSYQTFTEPAALSKIRDMFPNIELRIVWGPFHAKGYLFDYSSYHTLLIGSSNLTSQALTVNGEWNVLLTSLPGGEFYQKTSSEFETVWTAASPVTTGVLDHYTALYHAMSAERRKLPKFEVPAGSTDIPFQVIPNAMQKTALESLRALRFRGETKALVVSAPGTGKTILAALDVRAMKPTRVLYVVHRREIIDRSLESFRRVLGLQKFSYGIVGDGLRQSDADCVFAMVQTLNHDDNLALFERNDFDYIIIDEAHHSGASSYRKILAHFTPRFLLGITATPERTDGDDIVKFFDGNIAYSIRLNQALEAGLLCPFHYFGISDLTVDGQAVDDTTDFNLLVASERVEKIYSTLHLYARNWGDRSRGLIFVSRKKEAHELSRLLNEKGLKTLAITGDDSAEERARAIYRLKDDGEGCLEYIVTVDVFNEGIDIPPLNQIILLRPTQSAIVFTQQIGRGMRLFPGKEFVTIIDFIGNYSNNFLIPVALFGDASYSKDRLRKLLGDEAAYVPGESVVSFDRIAKEKIFAAINTANFSRLRFLRDSYLQIKQIVQRIPTMLDFVSLGGIDPILFSQTSGSNILTKSFYGFVVNHCENDLRESISDRHLMSLAFLTASVAQAKRPYEAVMLTEILCSGSFTESRVRYLLETEWDAVWDSVSFHSACNILANGFYQAAARKKFGEISYLEEREGIWRAGAAFSNLLSHTAYKSQVEDIISYCRHTWDEEYHHGNSHCLALYCRYTRQDVCRLLGWDSDVSSTLYGYRIRNNQCPIFVTYHKNEESTEASQMYEDQFLSPSQFMWMTRNNVRAQSVEPRLIRAQKESGLEILLFVKKSDDEGSAFHYLGPLNYSADEETTIIDSHGRMRPVVKIDYILKTPVEPKLYDYLTDNGKSAERYQSIG